MRTRRRQQCAVAPTARDLAIRPGVYQPRPLNAITDVAGVRIGQVTLNHGENARTGVTAVQPHGGNLFQGKVAGAVFVGNPSSTSPRHTSSTPSRSPRAARSRKARSAPAPARSPSAGRAASPPRRAALEGPPDEERRRAGDGSCMVVVATDAPVDARDLRRIAAGAVFGLGRTGSSYSNGSGDFAVTFSTSPEMRSRFNDSQPRASQVLPPDAMSPLFQATLEATEEAVYNSLLRATSVRSSVGRAEALPLDRLRALLPGRLRTPPAKASCAFRLSGRRVLVDRPATGSPMQTIIREAPFGVFLAMLAVPLAMAVVALFAGLKARGVAHAVADTPTVAIAAAEDGYRHIAGTAVAIDGEPLVAPLTESTCVWYSMRVEEWKRPLPSVGRNEWVTVKSDVSTAPLLVQDDTGICLVRLFGADITPTDRSQWTGATLDPEDRNPPRLGPGEPLHGVVQVSGLPHSRFRYREERIYPGDPVLAVGLLTTRPDDEDALDLSTAERITKTELGKGGRGQPLVVTTTAARTQAAMNAAGSQAAFTLALLPLGVAVLVLLARFS